MFEELNVHTSQTQAEGRTRGQRAVIREGFHREKSQLFDQVRSLLSQPQSEYNLGT